MRMCEQSDMLVGAQKRVAMATPGAILMRKKRPNKEALSWQAWQAAVLTPHCRWEGHGGAEQSSDVTSLMAQSKMNRCWKKSRDRQQWGWGGPGYPPS